MSEKLFGSDPYLNEATARVTALTPEGGVVLDRSLFYPAGGGQPGDSGWLDWPGGSMAVTSAEKGEGDDIVLRAAEGAALPAIGTEVRMRLDWPRRQRHMRLHTALHLLSVVIPLPVTGGAITSEKARLDFDMPEAPADKQAIEDRLNALIERALPVSQSWISDAELAARPQLVKTMSVKPPTGAGQVRLIRIGTIEGQVDLQPCGGTHVANTAEIGPVRLGKIEKKGRQNRRVNIFLVD